MLPLCVQLLLLWSRRHISVALDMHTLLDRKNISSRTNGQVGASRVTAYYQKAGIIDVCPSAACRYMIWLLVAQSCGKIVTTLDLFVHFKYLENTVERLMIYERTPMMTYHSMLHKFKTNQPN